MLKKIKLSTGKEYEVQSIESLKTMRLYGDQIASLLKVVQNDTISEMEKMAGVAKFDTLFTKLSNVSPEDLDIMTTSDFFLLVGALLSAGKEEEVTPIKKKTQPLAEIPTLSI